MSETSQLSTSAEKTIESGGGILAAIGEGLRGSHRDYTAGPIGPAIVALATPMILEMMMESIFAVVDVFFVAKLGANAIATVGLTESLITMIYALAIGLSIGATAIVARRIGEKDPEAAATAAGQTLLLGLFVGVVTGVFGALYAPDLLALMGASSEVIEQGSGFTRVMLGGNVVIVMLFLINAVFRGVGDAAIAMRVLCLANGINIALAPCLIFGLGPFPELGVVGAAIATTTGRGIGALYAFSQLFRKDGRICLRAHHFIPDLGIIKGLVRLSGSATFQTFIGMASWIGLVRILSLFGSQALAGYTIGIRVVIFVLLPAFGLSNAAATMVGQALGAGKPDRAERAVWLTGFYSACFLGTISLFLVIFTSQVIGIFTQEPEVLAFGTQCLRTVAFGFVFYAYGMVFTQSFNGAGDTWTPTWINLFAFWLFELPLGYLLASVLGFGPWGAFLAITLAFSLLAVVSGAMFRKGTWKTKSV